MAPGVFAVNQAAVGSQCSIDVDLGRLGKARARAQTRQGTG
jgi:hypothetical protein